MTSKEFGACITRLIEKRDFTRDEMANCLQDILKNAQSDMQQGAFLAALTAKGETAEEIKAVWQSIFDFDTVKIRIKTEN